MGIIDKLTGGSSTTQSNKYSDQSSTNAPAFGEDSTFGQNQSNSTYNQDISSANNGDSLLSDRNANSGLTGTSSVQDRGIDRQSERMGDMSLSNSDRRVDDSERRDSSLHLGPNHHSDKFSTQEAAPVVAERVHDKYTNIDKTRVEELHDRTEVKQTVQPIYDERTESVQRDRVDHGLEVHEHGKSGLDRRTEAELAAKRQQLSSEYRSSHDESTTETSMRPDVDVHERTNVVEEVVPVVERDIYRPHETEHTKRVVEIHHEAPVLHGTSTNTPMSLKDWEAQGHSVDTYKSSHTHRTRSGSSSSSSSSSSDEEGRAAGTHTTRRKKGLGEKVKETVGLDPKDNQNDPKDQAYGNTTTGYGSTTGTTGYDNSSSTGYGGERKKGIAEKGKEALGLDPKYNDPKDQGYSNTGTTTGTTGYSDSSQYGNTGSGNITGTDATGYGTTNYGGERKKGIAEKAKETLGLDPKDNQNDPKDQGFAGGNSTTTY